MKKSILITGLLFTVLIIIIFSITEFRSGISAVRKKDTPVNVVKYIWDEALESNLQSVKDVVSYTPSSFYDIEQRCVFNPNNYQQNFKDDNTASTDVSSKYNWFYDATIKMVDEIKAKELQLVEAKEERKTETEAVVKVSYKNMINPNLLIQTYFLLHKDDTGWKVFLVSENPWIFNQNFARFECPSM